ncbi:MAG: PTS system ascorbate-specific IIA component [Gammaproteobacteria bacterium]|nr:MAG: PTS system ascorbate-specific IIA component [Gammaproteobacteria bacterium]TND02947.1 MAG: PTS system, ascorbate-specific IIA component [Gammaproteobacteria bacterium]
MTVGLLLITHGRIGAALLDAAAGVLGAQPLPAEAIAVFHDSDPEVIAADARQRIAALGKDGGVLVLTDMYGSTPSNIACRLGEAADVVVVTGVNLPMLVRVMNYPRLSLAQLATKAVSGGSDGVFQCHRSELVKS